ncbi:MAG TPA: FecR domain-containing protein [Chitinophagaceae bacterium]|nr:FecR domain-containing protein [Chitinophagaceae bacterium]
MKQTPDFFISLGLFYFLKVLYKKERFSVDHKERFICLFRHYVEKRCTASEKQELMGYIDSGNYDLLLKQLISEQWEQSSTKPSFSFHYPEKKMEEDAIDTFAKIQARLYFWKIKRRRWITVAAAIFLFFISGVWFLIDRTNINKQQIVANNQLLNSRNGIPPGSNKAVLTLSNGQSIALDSARIGQLAIQGNRRVMKVNSGLLSYKNSKEAKGSIRKQGVHYNTLSIPRGGEYRLVLPDGSKVWINSASSIKFPTVFNGKYREVIMQGQCYFEIAKNPSKPFKVKVSSSGLGQKGAEVLVLGTHFDVMAYPDEPALKTTLLEGDVQVRQGNSQVQLKPGQQAVSDLITNALSVSSVDTEQVTAWKDGFFELGHTSLPVIMRQLARWYDIKVDYRKADDQKRFGGIISRNLPLSEILRMLANNGVHCQLQGHKLTVKSVE